jgi:hypothetical protein
LKDHFNGLEENRDRVVPHWLKSGLYRSFIPDSALPVEAELFSRDLETVLGFLRAEDLRRQQHSGAERLDRDSSPLG